MTEGKNAAAASRQRRGLIEFYLVLLYLGQQSKEGERRGMSLILFPYLIRLARVRGASYLPGDA